MEYLTTYISPDGQFDLRVSAMADTTVADLIAELLVSFPPPRRTPDATLSIIRSGQRIPMSPERPLLNSGLRHGDRLQFSQRRSTVGGLTLPQLQVVSGPSAGSSLKLLPGVNRIGHGEEADHTLADSRISRLHATITVTETVEVQDTNSANGTLIDGESIRVAQLRSGQVLTLGETSMKLEAPTRSNEFDQGLSRNDFIRSPILSPNFPEESHPAPEPPKEPRQTPFPIALLVAPLLMGVALYAVTQRVASLVFIALMPMMMVGLWFENRRTARRERRESWTRYRDDLARLDTLLAARQEREQLVRQAEHPSTVRLLRSAQDRSSLLWSRRTDKPGFAEITLGLGLRKSRVSVALDKTRSTNPKAWDELQTQTRARSVVAGVPVVADLSTCGSVGVVGEGDHQKSIAIGIVLQAVTLHAPSDLTVLAFLGPSSWKTWDWMKWLPHTRSGLTAVPGRLLVTRLGPSVALAEALDELISQRTSATDSPAPPQRILVVIGHDTPIDRTRLITLGERGPTAGVHLLWNAARISQLPASTRAFIATDSNGVSRAGLVAEPDAVAPLNVHESSEREADYVARALAPIRDLAMSRTTAQDLPDRISYFDMVGSRMGQDPEAVIERWRETGSLSESAAPTDLSTKLRALLGQTAEGPLVIDIVNDGPHALVGGTTGAGKSELLQTWIAALANDYSPDRVNFLLVDYKGGSAFADCVDLPHSVGLVTDLTPRLVNRALGSLNAEIRYRERLLNRLGAKDLQTLERAAHPSTPPRLIIVVDEFAALVAEIPEFVDGTVDIAQRGRSLGLHLILATQRPTGVIRDNLRANTGLRIALRVADPQDSLDVLGTDIAASFNQDIPGRAAARNGASSPAHFQTAFLGGRTIGEEQTRSRIALSDFTLDNTEIPPASDGKNPALLDSNLDAPTDLQRLVSCIGDAARVLGLNPPRRPWLPELAAFTDLQEICEGGTPGTGIPFAIADRPDLQTQTTVTFDPHTAGNLAIYGTGGTGKSTALRSLAVAASLSDSENFHIYGLDCGSRGLAALAALPTVGAIVELDDRERAARLIRRLLAQLDERAATSASEHAGTPPTPHRTGAGEEADRTRALLLIDGFTAFRKAYELSPTDHDIWDGVLRLATDGRSAGIHVILTADRPGAISTSVASVVSERLVLRLANETDSAFLNVPKSLISDTTQPGRGVFQGAEIQVASLTTSPSINDETEILHHIAKEISSRRPVATPAPVPRLATRVNLMELPTQVLGLPTVGVAHETLAPVGLRMGGPLVITGPPGSGRGATTTALVRSSVRSDPKVQTALLAPSGSRLETARPWNLTAIGIERVSVLAADIAERQSHADSPRWMIVLEDPAEFVNGHADAPLQALVKATKSQGHTILAEADTQSLQGSWPLLLALRSARRGIALQPDRSDGDLIFRTPFPRIDRQDFPKGRGLLVENGTATRVQFAC